MPNASVVVLREALFPPLCYGCKTVLNAHDPLCGSCQTAFHSEWKTICPVCEKEKTFLQKRRCSHAPGFLSTLSYITLYDHPVVRGLIHTLKYSGIKNASTPFIPLLEREKVNLLRIPVDMVVPIPLHARRKRERGFNQAEQIAQNVSDLLSLPLRTDILVRRRSSPPQARSNKRADRVKNVLGLYKVSGEFQNGCSILLVDDVSTSGSTLEECAKTLVRSGAKAVHAFTLAREE